MAEKILEVVNLGTRFKTERGVLKAIDGVSFDVYRGEMLGIVGESGCGKSVTSQSILRLYDEKRLAVYSGEVRFEGKNLFDLSEKEMQDIRGEKISMVFQDALSSLNPVFTVGNQIMESLMIHRKISKQEAKDRAIEMLGLVGIPDPQRRFYQYPFELSGGMRQRIMIAVALACSPKVLIADEPTTALDVTIQAQIMELLKSLQVNEGKSIILITHNMGLVAEMADEVCVMYMGRVVEFGSLEDIFDHTSHPYTKALLRSVPVLGLGDDQKLEAIPGVTPNPADLKEGCEFADRCSECMEKCRKGKIPAFEVSPGHKVRCLKFDSYPEVK